MAVPKLPKIRLTDAPPHAPTLVRDGIMKDSPSTKAMDRIMSKSLAPGASVGVNKAIRMGAGVGPRKGR